MLPKPIPDDLIQEKDQQREDKDRKLRDGEVDGAQQGNVDRLEVDENADFRGEEESELDSELEALMRENSDYSSSSSSENDSSTSQTGDRTGPTKAKGNRVKRRSRNRSTYETPVNTVAVLVVACWMLRIPVMYRDFNGYVLFVSSTIILIGV